MDKSARRQTLHRSINMNKMLNNYNHARARRPGERGFRLSELMATLFLLSGALRQEVFFDSRGK